MAKKDDVKEYAEQLWFIRDEHAAAAVMLFKQNVLAMYMMQGENYCCDFEFAESVKKYCS